MGVGGEEGWGRPPVLSSLTERRLERLGLITMKSWRRMSLEGRSHDSEYWKKKVADWKLAHLTNLDKDFCMDEVLDAARHLQDHKAPGEDGIVGEWMKAVLYMKKEPGEKEGKPSAMARVLLWAIQ